MSNFETREFRRSDIPALMTLIRRNGFPNRSVKGWEWALFDYPEQGELAPGLISLKDGEICAFVGIQIREYSGKNGQKRVAMGHTLMTNDAGRGRGLSLARKVINHPGVDAMQTTSSNPNLAPLLTRMGVTAAHGEAGRQYVDWVVRPGLRFVGRGLNFLARSEAIYGVLSRAELFGRAPKPPAKVTATDQVKSVDFTSAEACAAFDSFSAALSEAHPEAYLPVRSAEVYKWRMADPDLPARSQMLACVKDGHITAILTTTLTKPNTHEPWINFVTDFACLPGAADDAALAGLFNEARRQTRLRGATLLRFKPSLHLPKQLLSQCGPHALKTEPHDNCFVNFAEGETEMQAAFCSSPFEADHIFALRAPTPKGGV